MKSGEFFLTILAAALVSAGVSYGMNRRHDAPLRTMAEAADTVEVPAMVGLRPDQARALLESRGLVLTIAAEREEAHIEAGKVCQQTPLEGSRMRRGETVRVEIARPVATAAVPNLIGKPAAKAKELLVQAGFALGNLEYRSNEDRNEGSILEQAPPAGQAAAKGSRIDMVVNRTE